MDTQKFARRQFALEAVQVTPTNMNEVARWCGGKVAPADYKMMGGIHKMPEGCVLLPKQGLKANKTYKVLIGHWITKHNGQFRTWTLEAFEASFEPVAPNDEFKKNDLVKVLPHPDVQPWEGWEGKVVDAVLVGVDFGRRGLVVFEPSRLTKISEMDSLQLEFNAGIEIASSPEAMLEQMREESKDKIAALEKENLEYDENEIREGDLVKTCDDPQLVNEHYQNQCGHVRKIENGLYTVEFATADPEKSDLTDFTREALTKLRQDGEALNAEEPFDMAIPPALGEKGDELLSPDAIEHFRTLTTEDFAKFVAVQKIGEEALEQVGHPFEVGDLVETLVEHEFDGVTIPVGTNARVCVIGVEFVGEPGTDGIEVLFADGHYNTFMPKDIKKV